MNKDLVRDFNAQINQEFYSAYLYLDISSFYAEKGLDGFASWFSKQAEDEKEHALKLMRYLHGCGRQVDLQPIAGPERTYETLAEPLAAAWEHELGITYLINNLYDFAVTYKDYQAADFLAWFVKEQAEEMAAVAGLVKKMELYGSDGSGLYLLNQELGKR